MSKWKDPVLFMTHVENTWLRLHGTNFLLFRNHGLWCRVFSFAKYNLLNVDTMWKINLLWSMMSWKKIYFTSHIHIGETVFTMPTSNLFCYWGTPSYLMLQNQKTSRGHAAQQEQVQAIPWRMTTSDGLNQPFRGPKVLLLLLMHTVMIQEGQLRGRDMTSMWLMIQMLSIIIISIFSMRKYQLKEVRVFQLEREKPVWTKIESKSTPLFTAPCCSSPDVFLIQISFWLLQVLSRTRPQLAHIWLVHTNRLESWHSSRPSQVLSLKLQTFLLELCGVSSPAMLRFTTKLSFFLSSALTPGVEIHSKENPSPEEFWISKKSEHHSKTSVCQRLANNSHKNSGACHQSEIPRACDVFRCGSQGETQLLHMDPPRPRNRHHT